METCHNNLEQKKKNGFTEEHSLEGSQLLPCHMGSSRNRGVLESETVGEVCKMCSPWVVIERQNFLL